jgi:hypothetical protein
MVKAITFDLDGGDLKVPVVGQYELNLPPYFATKTKKGWKLLNPITTIRNLAKRNKELVVDLNRSPSSLEPEIAEEDGVDMPSIEDFNPTDQKKLRRWEANQNKQGVYPKTDKPVRPRGRPAFLPKNARLQGLTYKKGTKHYGDNLNKKKKPEPESESDEEHYDEPPPPPSPPQSDSESESESEEEEEEKRPRGRPKTKATLEKERRLTEEKAEAERRKKADEERKTREAREKAEEDRKRKENESEASNRKSMGGEDKRSAWKKRLAEYTKSFDSETQFQIHRLEEKNDNSKYNGQIAYLRDTLQAQKPRWEKEKADAEAELQGLIKKVKEDPKNQFDDKGRWIIQGEYRNKHGNTAKATYHLDLETGKYTNKSKKDNGKSGAVENTQAGQKGQIGIYKSGVGTGNRYFEPSIDPKDFPKPFVSDTEGSGGVEVPSFTPYRGLSYQIQQVWKNIMESKWRLETPPIFIPIYERKKEEKRGKLNKEIEDLKKERKAKLEEWVGKNRPSGSGLSGGLTKDTALQDEYESNDEDDGEGGGSLFSGLLSKVKSLVINPIEAVVNKVGDIGNKVIHGRMDYPPSAKAIIDKYGDQQVQGVSLHRLVLPSVYTGILSLWTGGETARRLKEEPKDKLFHISMWVKLPNAVILCEKNEVIHLKVNPTKAKEEEEADAPTPSNTTFRELLEKGRASVGDEKFFSYSAKSNNCGNWIEYILRANGIENQGTKDFIGQDAHKILEGFPRLRRTLNTLTDIAGRANVVLEGGDLPDWEHLKWGSFTKQFERYNQEHPDNGIEDLEHFARSILANPKEYQPRTLKRARFYLNVILKKKSHHNNIMPSHRITGGAVIRLPNGDTKAVGSDAMNMRPLGADPRTRSPMPIHALHPNAMDTIFHDPKGHPSAMGIHHHHHYHLAGGDIWGDIGNAFDPNKNGVAKAFDPNQNGVAQAFAPNGSAEQFGKQVASQLIHRGLPIAGQLAGNALGDFLMPETGGLGGFALGQAGKAGGNALGDYIGNETGYGLKKPKRLVKGSAEAKAFMASIRKKKMKGGAIPAPRSRNVITDPSML